VKRGRKLWEGGRGDEGRRVRGQFLHSFSLGNINDDMVNLLEVVKSLGDGSDVDNHGVSGSCRLDSRRTSFLDLSSFNGLLPSLNDRSRRSTELVRPK